MPKSDVDQCIEALEYANSLLALFARTGGKGVTIDIWSETQQKVSDALSSVGYYVGERKDPYGEINPIGIAED